MLKQFISGSLHTKAYIQILKATLLTCNLAALFVYGSIHLIFFDIPFDGLNELLTAGKLMVIATAFSIALSLLLLLTDATERLWQQRKSLRFSYYAKTLSAAAVALILFLSACSAQASAGAKKDLGTGLSCTYKIMEPEKIFLIMNKEMLSHTDIPIGESFLLVNDGIKGLQIKKGIVSVGCSLLIKDKKGKILLNEKDLFAGHDTFKEKDAKMLKCTVSTGKPMQWEEKYDVTVIFWDKYGTGKIENKVTIRIIDIP